MAADVKGIIYGINGPVIYIKGKTAFRMGEMVYVGPQKLVGEVIRLDSSRTTIQVYEETTGLKPGDEVYSTGAAISVFIAVCRLSVSAIISLPVFTIPST